MAFNKFANASIVKPAITWSGWGEVRAKALSLGPAFDMKRASSKQVLQKYTPGQYLLSHCTIIASVDTEVPAGTITGKQMVDGFHIDRQYADFMIAPGTSQYINNNNDCWERKLLLASFRTFIGGENYVEHLQIPELSKGKIVDAAARDIGDSVYIDILVATDRKHGPLVKAVTSGEIQTLSMGCQVGFTICTKCGNVAEDETQLCSHIRYMKGNTFLDSFGKPRKIAELCGHVLAEPGSVKFIEASWVANPAFTGAVLRNILSPAEAAALNNQRVQVAFSFPTRTLDPNAMGRAASGRTVAQGDQGQGQGQGQNQDFGFEGQEPSDTQEDPMDKAVNDLTQIMRDKAVSKLRGEMSGRDAPRADHSENRNDSLVREAVSKSAAWRSIALTVAKTIKDPQKLRRVLAGLMLYKSGGWKSLEGQFAGAEILSVSQAADRLSGIAKIAGEDRVYRTISEVGGMSVYQDVDSYLSACRRVMGRDVTTSERDALIAKGRLFDLGTS